MSLIRKLALYSDQACLANRAMDARLLHLIGRRQPTIGYVPSTAYPDPSAFRRKADYYAGIGANLVMSVDPRLDASTGQWSRILACDAIHLSGGNTFLFLAWLRERRVLPLLMRYVAEGGVLIGESAGAILMTPSVTSAVLCGDVRRKDSVDDTALGLVDFTFWPHFNREKVRRTQLTLASTLPNLYACPDGAGVIVDGKAVELFGRVSRPWDDA